MNIGNNKIQGLQMPVCGQLWEGHSVLLAYDAGLTEGRAWSVRGQLEVGAELPSDDLLQPVSGDVAESPMQQRPVYSG